MMFSSSIIHKLCNRACAYRRIGSDEEQQLLRTAKDDLNISSSNQPGAVGVFMHFLILCKRIAEPCVSFTVYALISLLASIHPCTCR